MRSNNEQWYALVVIDVQNGMFAEADPVYQGARLLETIGDLLTKARGPGAGDLYSASGQ